MGIVLPDDTVDGRQSESRSMSDLFGGKERLEDMVAHVICHTAAVILKRKPYIFTGQHAAMQTCILGIHPHPAGLDDDPSLIAESILGIHDQIQDDLPHLGFVRLYVGAFGVELQLYT